MNQTQNKNKKKTTQASLGLSLMPSIFASGCCAITPIAFLFGFTSAEFLFTGYEWFMRALGVLILVTSVTWYFYRQGITTKEDIQNNRNIILITVIQTLVITLGIYIFLTQLAVPVIWTQVLEQTTNCCGL